MKFSRTPEFELKLYTTHRLFDVKRGALQEGSHQLVRVPRHGVGSTGEVCLLKQERDSKEGVGWYDCGVGAKSDIYCILSPPQHQRRFSSSPGSEPLANN